MIKMLIKMDENRIKESEKYSLDKVYSALDRIFRDKGMVKVSTDNGIEYCGNDRPIDFAYFGKIMIGLKKQDWFMDNVSEWLFCSNDDTDDANVFNQEDLLIHYGRKAIA